MKIISLNKGFFTIILGLLLWCCPARANHVLTHGAMSTCSGRPIVGLIMGIREVLLISLLFQVPFTTIPRVLLFVIK